MSPRNDNAPTRIHFVINAPQICLAAGLWETRRQSHKSSASLPLRATARQGEPQTTAHSFSFAMISLTSPKNPDAPTTGHSLRDGSSYHPIPAGVNHKYPRQSCPASPSAVLRTLVGASPDLANRPLALHQTARQLPSRQRCRHSFASHSAAKRQHRASRNVMRHAGISLARALHIQQFYGFDEFYLDRQGKRSVEGSGSGGIRRVPSRGGR